MYDAADSSPIDDARSQAAWGINKLLAGMDSDALRAALAVVLPGIDASALERALRGDASALWPGIRLVGSDVLGSAYAAYSAGLQTIFVSEAALARELVEPGSLVGSLLEELGHHLDALFGAADSAGDEGAAFRTLVLTGGAMAPRLYDDHGVVWVDGADTAVEFASYSKGGGFEGDVYQLKLEGSGDNELTYSYAMQTIPDQLSIRYEGKTLFNTGFVSGNGSGKLTVKRGTADFVVLTLGTADSGTAWDYSASTTGSGLKTSPLIISTINDFKDDDKDGTYEYSGAANFGMEGGSATLIRLTGATFKADKTKVSVAGATVSGATGGFTKTLFTGSFDLTYATGVASSLNTGKFFSPGGVTADLEGFIIYKDQVRFDTTFKLTNELGGQTVDTQGVLGSGVFVLDSSGLHLNGPGGKYNIPDFSFRFFSFFNVAGKVQSVSYNAVTDALRYQGTLETALFLKADPGSVPGVSPNTLSLDLSGDNFAEIKAGVANFKGAIILKEIGFSGFKLENLSLNFDTVAKTIGAGLTIKIPTGAVVPDKSLTIAAGITYEPFQFNSFKAEVAGLNIPLGVLPGVTLQKLGLTFDHLAASDTAPGSVSGLVGFAEGPVVNVGTILGVDIGKVSLLQVDYTGTVDRKFNLSGGVTSTILHPQIITQGGTAAINWEDGTLAITGAFSAFFGVVGGTGTLKGDKNLNFSENVSATISFPPTLDLGFGLNFLRGYSLAGGRFVFTYTNDGNFSNDYVALWGNLGTHVYGLKLKFDGDIDILDGSNLPTVSAAARLDAGASQALGAATDAVAVPTGAPYLLLVLNWTTTAAAQPQLTVTRPDGVVISQADFAANNIKILPELTKAGQVVVEVDPPGAVAAGRWSIAPVSATGLGVVTSSGLAGLEANGTLALTAANTVAGVTIGYTGAVTGTPTGTVDLYYDTDGSGFDGVPIAAGLALTSTGYAWTGDGLKPGTYFIYGAVTPEGSTPRFAYAPTPVVIAASSDVRAEMIGPSSADTAAGNTLTYTVRVTNGGGSSARNVVVNETTEAGAFSAYTVTGAPGGAVAADGRFSVNVGDLAAGASRDVVVTLTTTTAFRNALLADPRAVFIDSAVSTTSYDPDITNNSPGLRVDWRNSTKAPGTQANVDLKVELMTAANAAAVGGSQSYQIKVTNSGPDAAANVILREYATGLLNATASVQGGGSASIPQNGSANINLGTLASGASKVVTVTGRALFAGDTISTSLVDTANGFDRNFSNNGLTQYRNAAVGAALIADASLTGTVSTTTPLVGDTVTLTYTLANGGPNVASALTVKLEPGSGLELLSGSSLQGSFSASTGVWTVGNISENISRTLTVQAKVTAAANFGVTAEIASQGEADPDSTPGNGVATEDDYVALLGGGVVVTPPVTTGPRPVTPVVPTSQQIRLDTQFGNLSRIDPTKTDMTSLSLVQDGKAYPNPFLAQLTLEKAIAAALDAGSTTVVDAQGALTRILDGTTSVAEISYAFFTGRTPSAAGLNYLVHSDANANDLNDAYYSQFSTENRYINFAVALAKGGPGASTFASQYGSLSLQDAATRAYQQVFGTPATASKITDILGELVPNGRGGLETRAQYFAEYGGDGASGLGAKAAMMGYLLAESVKVGFGAYQQANLHFLQSLAYGQAAYEVDLLAVYGPPITVTGTPAPDASVFG